MADLIRLSLMGSLPGGEVWSVNPVYAVEPPGLTVTYSDLLTIATGAAGVTIPADLLVSLGTTTSFTGVRAEARTSSGTLEAAAEYIKPSPVAGTGTQYHPYQTARVISLRTNTPGARGRGRLYWPATSTSLSSATLRASSPSSSAMATAAASYLTLIEAQVQTVIPLSTLHVWSRTSGTLDQVQRIMVGDVLDVQRRRRDALAESYATVAY